MSNISKLVFILFYICITLKNARALDEHIYECPIKSICQLIIDHYRMDATKSLMFERYKEFKIREGEIKKIETFPHFSPQVC